MTLLAAAMKLATEVGELEKQLQQTNEKLERLSDQTFEQSRVLIRELTDTLLVTPRGDSSQEFQDRIVSVCGRAAVFLEKTK